MPVHRFPYAVVENPLDVLQAAADRVEGEGEQLVGWTDYGNEIVVVTIRPRARKTAADRRETR